jgi:hypothetical protein
MIASGSAAAVAPAAVRPRQCSQRRAHRADLHRRGVRAQQAAVTEIERVVHRAGRMVRGDVQRREVVEVVFDLGAGGHAEAGFAEQRLDAQPRFRVTGCRPPCTSPRPGSVTSMRPASSAVDRRGGQRRAARVDGGLHAFLGFVDAGARGRTLGSRQRRRGTSAVR